MLRRFLDHQLLLTEKDKPLQKFRPLVEAGDTFLYEPAINTKRGPHIRDAVDIKRWMILVVIALLPAILMGIWNTGIQSMVYSSGNYQLMNEFLASGHSFSSYIAFIFTDNRYLTILKDGLSTVLPIILVSYAVGGFWEGLFACIRRHPISEGFLVTGILYALILPPTIPLWMVAVGVSVGVIFAKEVFGGSGMNIVNPALACRAFLFFGFPGKMSGNVWVGNDPTVVRESLLKMNREAQTTAIDGYTQATKLAQFNISQDVKRIHVDAIAANSVGERVGTHKAVVQHFGEWSAQGNNAASLGELSQEQMKSFVTSPSVEGGLGLSPGSYEDAYHFSTFQHDLGDDSNWSFFFGNKLGCIGETSGFAILLGAIFLIYTGIGSWRTMVAMGLGAYLTALLFQWGANIGADGGAWNPAQFGLPAYKHLLVGGLAFGAVFMATDPVSSPDLNTSKWIYGLFCGAVAIIIRIINPAYPEGVMLAILMGNVLSPLLDYYVALHRTKRSQKSVPTTT